MQSQTLTSHSMLQLASTLDKDTPDKKKFAELLRVMAETAWHIEVDEDYRRINLPFDYIRGCEIEDIQR